MVIGIVVSEPLVDIALFSISLDNDSRCALIVYYDVIRLTIIHIMITTIFVNPKFSDYPSIWNGSKYQIITLSLLFLFVTYHCIMVKIWTMRNGNLSEQND